MNDARWFLWSPSHCSRQTINRALRIFSHFRAAGGKMKGKTRGVRCGPMGQGDAQGLFEVRSSSFFCEIKLLFR